MLPDGRLEELFAVDRRTLGRWRREIVLATPFWRAVSGRFRRPLAEDALPGSLLAVFRGERGLAADFHTQVDSGGGAPMRLIEERPEVGSGARMLHGHRDQATVGVLLEERVLVQVMGVRDDPIVERDLEGVRILEVLNSHRQPP